MKLYAGAGCAEIKFPPELFPIEGFMGVHDLPHARVLVIDCGERIAIAALELVNAGEALELARDIVERVTGAKAENVWVHVTHAITTPHIPRDPSQLPPGQKLPPHMVCSDPVRKRAIMLQSISDAVTEAATAAAVLRPARMGAGSGESRVNVNRDVETPDGWWIGINPDGPSDKEMQLLRFETLDGVPIAVLACYGLKPCAIDNSEMDEGTRLISSDVPGLACAIVEKSLGAPCLFIMSAAGDQVPREMAVLESVLPGGAVVRADLGVAKGLEIVSRLGTELAGDITAAAEKISCAEDTAPVRTAEASVPCRMKGRTEMRPQRKADFTFEREGTLSAQVMTVGNAALVAAKPEINCETARQLRAASPFEHTLLFTMTNGEMKYMPQRSAYERCTWEAQSAMLMEGSAEDWVEAASDALESVYAPGKQ